MIIAATAIYVCSAPASAEFESVPVLRASEVLPERIIAGTYYAVDERVPNDGFLNRYTLRTTFGELTVDGTDLLQKRIRETYAIGQMETMRRSDAFKSSFEKALLSPLRGAKNLITAPVDTVTGFVSGVGSFFKQVGHTVAGSPSYQETGTLKAIVGFDSTKRGLAHKFGVDPYSSNPLLQDRLEELTWAAFGGGFVVRIGTMAIPSPAKLAVKAPMLSNSMNNLNP